MFLRKKAFIDVEQLGLRLKGEPTIRKIQKQK